MNSRRNFIATFAAVLASRSLPSAAQGRQLRKIAFLMPTSTEPHYWEALKKQLAALGYAEGRDVVYESRSAEGRLDRLPKLAEELVQAKPDLIVTGATPGVRAARAATATIPIVIATAGDPVSAGLVPSLSRPGGNITGISNIATETSAKTLELARSTLPAVTRVAILSNPGNSGSTNALNIARSAAATLGLTVVELQARAPSEIETAFAKLTKDRAGALFVLSNPFLESQREKIASLARTHRVPMFSQTPEFARAGALMIYGADYAEHFKRAASFVDRILKGAKPGDLPIEQAAIFALIVNNKTAAALGIKVPQEILLRATEVIE